MLGRLTARGVRKSLDKTYAREDNREKNVMEVFAKGGSSAVAKLFNNSDVNNRGFTFPGFRKSKEDDIEQAELNPTIGSTYNYAMSTSEEGYMNALKQNFGLDDETAARFMANGDPTVFERLYNKVIDAQKFYQEQDIAFKNTPRSEQFIGEIIASSVEQSASPSGRININKVEDYIGRELDGLYKSMLQQQEMPRGQVILGEKFLGEDITIDQELKIVTAGVNSTANHALTIVRNLNERLKQLKNVEDGVKVLPSGKIEQVEPRSLTEGEKLQQDFYIRYLRQLDEALEKFNQTGEDKDPLPLLNIFGASGLENYLVTKPRLKREIDGLPVNSYIRSLIDIANRRNPIFVPIIPGRPSTYENWSADKVPEEQSFIYELIHGDYPVFFRGAKVATYSGAFEDAPQNIIESLRY